MVRATSNNSGLIRRAYGFLGASEMTPHHWLLQTNLTMDELSSVWLGLGIEYLNAGIIDGLQSFPAIRNSFGLTLHASERLDLIAADSKWRLLRVEACPDPCPVVVLAGLPSAGKSHVACELSKLLRVPTQWVYTSRQRRVTDPDFDTGGFFHLDDENILPYRRSPAYAFPVLFRGEKYFFSSASLIERFQPNNELVVFVDSHFSRIKWRLALMPDIKIVWLEASPDDLAIRLSDRRTAEGNSVSEHYAKGCEDTRKFAHLIIDTTGRASTEVAARIKEWISLEVRN